MLIVFVYHTGHLQTFAHCESTLHQFSLKGVHLFVLLLVTYKMVITMRMHHFSLCTILLCWTISYYYVRHRSTDRNEDGRMLSHA